MSSGVCETRVIQIPGSYMRAARVERTVTLFSHAPSGVGCGEKSMACRDR
ncbi:hypothetical protein SO3561_09903 [Streptomyces olivochromogenes]|uniref:Uncharacterized protein n=1 Tax=Streptomyces olivochromogenes TaxID=1963 RepID=A0A250VWJ0_STROL|nr:hypothetical protein SO3561_09903 [Streptomyces olivochromogenes]